MISLDKCKRSCDTFDHLQKYVFRVKQKTDVKVFNTKTKNDSKTLTKHISSDYKCKLNSTIYNSNQKWKIQIKPHTRKKYYSWSPSTRICENSIMIVCI